MPEDIAPLRREPDECYVENGKRMPAAGIGVGE